MTVVESEAVYMNNGEKFVRCTIYSDTVPSPMPEPADIPGYDDTFEFTPDSQMVIDTTGAVYLAGEDGAWHEF